MDKILIMAKVRDNENCKNKINNLKQKFNAEIPSIKTDKIHTIDPVLSTKSIDLTRLCKFMHNNLN